MSLSTAKLWMALGILAIPLMAIGACNGADFSAEDSASSGGSAGSGGKMGSGGSTVGSGGSHSTAGSGGSGTRQACAGPEDCNDNEACTIDLCGGDGFCTTAPKCADGKVCCAGDCGECCANEDCNDGIECTNDICFAASCTHVPNDAKCETNQYCATADGCRQKEPCPNGVAECDDANLCTADSCTDALCSHESCDTEMGVLCCEEFGCGECCVDSQCDDEMPCTQDLCTQGQCSHVPLCAGELECCPSADGTTATCGACCSAGDCRDAFDCTDDSCSAGDCRHTPNPSKCANGQICDPSSGCKAATGCQGDGDCNDQIACTDDACREGSCMNVPNNGHCLQGETCSVQLKKCVQCTTDVQCDDLSECTRDSCVDNKCVHTQDGCGQGLCCGNVCRPQCCSAYDCGVALPLLPPDSGGPELCSYSTCDNTGMCQYLSTYCAGFCCPYTGCSAYGCDAI